MTSRGRGRPPTVSDATIQSVRAALARGDDVAAVARAHRLSRRYVRDILAGIARPEPLPREIVAVLEADPNDQRALSLADLWPALKAAELQLTRARNRGR